MKNMLRVLSGIMFICALSSNIVTAQNLITVGTGTNTYAYAPAYSLYNYSFSRMLYLSSDLQALSSGGKITHIAFYISTAQSGYTLNNQTVYMRGTTVASENTGYIDPTVTSNGCTQVWTGNLNVSNTGWVTIPLSTPFTLPAGQNLEIFWNNMHGSYFSTVYWQSTGVSYNAVSRGYSDNSFASATTSNLATATERPNIQITFLPSGRTAAVTEIVSPRSSIMLGGLLTAQANIANLGTDTITSCRINWSVNNVLYPPVYDSTLLLAGAAPTSITLGNYMCDSDQFNNITVWIDQAMPYDSAQVDDTLSFDFYACSYQFNGVYTVGGPTADYATLGEVLIYLTNCGVTGPTTFILNTGVYNQPIVLSGSIPGLSEINTVTFTSATQDADSVLIYAVGTTVQLNAAKHLRFSYLTLGNTSINSTYGVEFNNGAKDIDFYGCKINSYVFATSSSYAPVYYYGASGSGYKLEDVTFINNTLDGGYASMYLYYSGSGSGTDMSSMVIDSNVMTNAYYYGVYNYYYTYCSSFSHNVISMRASATTNYGMYFGGSYNTLDRMEGNKVRFRNTGSRYGIYFGSYLNRSESYNAFGPAYIVNNEILSDGGSTNYGIYLGSYPNAYLVYNSVYVAGSGTSYALYFPTMNSTYSLTVKNNMFIAAGSGTPYPLYSSSIDYVKPYNGTILDYNNYYGSKNSIAYIGNAVSDLQSMQTLTEQDVHSQNVYPNFVNLSQSLHTDGSMMIVESDVETKFDVEGDKRVIYTNMGCYNDYVISLNNDVTISNLLSPLDWQAPSTNIALDIKITNKATDTLKNVRIYWSINNSPVNFINYNCNLAWYEESEAITLDSIVLQSGVNSLLVYTTLPNGLSDANVFNDTLQAEIISCVPLSGNYTVGSQLADFVTLDEAIDYLNSCGVSGPTTLLLHAGDYVQTMTLTGSIPGLSASNAVTFTSLAQDPDSVKIYTNGTALELVEAKHLRFSYLTLGSTSSKSTYGVEFIDGALDVHFYACNIYANLLSTSSSYVPVYYSGSNGSGKRLENVSFVKNKLEGGYASFFLYYPGSGEDTSMSQIVIDSNIMLNAYYYGVRVYSYGYFPSISYNTISMRNSSTTNYVICFEGSYNTIDNMIGNKIRFGTTSSRYGIYISSANLNESPLYKASGPALIANNEIISTGGSSNYGIYFANTNVNAKVLHNSILLSGTSTSYAIRIPTMSAEYALNIKNNVFVTTSTGTAYPLYASSANYVKQSYGTTLDYNNYYSTGEYLAYISGTKSSLLDIQLASEQDAQSISQNPDFVNPSLDLHTSSTAMLVPLDSTMMYDIDRNQRLMFTNMGCYHDFVANNLDVSLQTLVSPTETSPTNQNTALEVMINNSGIDTLRSVRFYWSVNQSAIDSMDYACLISPLQNSEVVLLDSVMLHGGENTIKVYTAYPNGLVDANTVNDTLLVHIAACDTMLNGEYIVGTGGDFANVEKAFNTLMRCGINGPVELKCMPFTSGSFKLDVNVPGADSINTVTFSSLSGNPSDVKIVSTDGNALTLDGVSNYIFKNISIDATAGTNGVEFLNTCSNILFYGCNIMANPTTTSSSYTAVRYYQASGSTTYLSNISFIKNKISGGYHNMYFYYACGSSSKMSESLIRIDSNELTDAYYYGIYAYYYGNYKSVSYNTITSRATSSTFYAIYFNMYNTVQDGVIGNRIFLQNTSTGYGIRTYYINRSTSYAAQGNALIANNEVIGNAGGSTYGIYTQYSNADFYNNSIYLTGSSSCYGLYISSTSSTYSMNFLNNLFITTTSGTGYPIYTDTANYVTTSYGTVLDYNNYYSTGSYVGYISGTKTSLSALKSATLQDTNSVSIQPQFLGINNGLELLNYSGLSCLKLDGVSHDIRNVERDSLTFMGCYTPNSLDVALAPSTLTPDLANVHQGIIVAVKLQNPGKTTLTTSTITLSVDGVVTKVIPWSDSLVPGAEIPLYLDTMNVNAGSNDLRIWISNPNGSVDLNNDNDTLQYNIYGCDTLLNGQYTIGVSGADYVSFQDALQAMIRCGINGPVTFRVNDGVYNENLYINTALILGSNSQNTISFVSTSGNAANVILGNHQALGASALVLDGASNLIFKDITIGLNSENTGVAVEFLGMCENIEFNSCIIQTYDQATSNTYCGVKYYNSSSSSNYLKNVKFVHNHIDGGYYNFWFYYSAGTSSNMGNMSVIIDSNTLSNAYYAGFYTYYNGNYPSVSYNTITSRTNENVGTDWYGIYTYYYTNIENIVGNKIQNINVRIAQPRGIYIHYYFNYTSYSGSGQGLIANNEILLYGANATNTYQNFAGLYIYYPYSSTKILHNSIYLYGADPATLTGAALYAYNTNTSYLLKIQNNVFSTAIANNANTCLIPYYISSLTYARPNYVNSDYNNYYNAYNQNVAYAGEEYTLVDLRAANMQDAHSVQYNPGFANLPFSLMPTHWTICPKEDLVSFDMLGNARVVLTYSGCYHVNYSSDAGIVEFMNIGEKNTAGLNPLDVRLVNYGSAVLNSVTIRASVDGVLIPAVNLTGLALVQNQDTIIHIGNFTSVLNHTNTIKAWTSNPNGMLDQNNLNDSMSITTKGCVEVLSGVYDIAGGNNDFATIQDALSALEDCGIAGPVVLRLANGIYPDLNNVGTFTGTNETNTITFTSLSGNADDVVIGSPTDVALSLFDAGHLRFENISIGNSSSTYGVQFINHNEDIVFYQCNIYSAPGMSSTSYAGIYYYNSSGSTNTLKNVRIVKNNISGGYANIYFYYPGGSSSNMTNMSVTIDSNIMTDAYTYGLYSYYNAMYESISYNTIITASASTTQYGLYLNYYNTIVHGINANRLRMQSTSSAYGIRCYYINDPSYGAQSNALISNNEIVCPEGSSTKYGIYTYYTNADFYNNSVYLAGTSTNYGFYISTTSSSYSMNIKNNIFYTATTGTGYPIYTGTADYAKTTYGTVIDYNNYYSTGTYVGYIAGTKSTIFDLRASTGQDQNSVSTNVSFMDITKDLRLLAYSGLSCPKIVDEDIDGKSRNASTFMGCYESDSLDAAISMGDISHNSTQLPLPVYAVLTNKGLTTLNNAILTWSFKDTVRMSTPWTGSLDQGETDTVLLGNVSLTYGSVNNLKLWVSLPNGATDNNVENDTVKDVVYGCYGPLSGVYTIGGPTADFATIADALEPITYCGIVGPVTFSLNDGTFNENVVINIPIPGASILNTITFTSTSGNPANVVIGSNLEKAGTALLIEEMNYLNFTNITIGLNSEYTATAVELKGMCENILFTGCRIQSYDQANSTMYCGVKYQSYSGATNYLKNVKFIGNHIDGGYYNFYLYYSAGSSTNMEASAMSVTIDSNVLSNAYYAGVYSYYYANYPSISYNTILARTSGVVNADWYGIYTYYYHNVERMVNNKIKSTHANITNPRGIYIYYYFNYSSYGGLGRGLIANNEIILQGANMTSDFNAFTGIYIYYPYSNMQILHNSIYLYGTDPNTMAGCGIYAYNTTTSYQITIKNNDIATYKDGSSLCYLYPYYVTSATYADASYIVTDYNNYYNDKNANIAFTGVEHTLASLKVANLQDENSLSINPGFGLNPTNLVPQNWSTCLIVDEVNNDIHGDLRLGRITYKGCYTAIFGNDAGVTEFVGLGQRVTAGSNNIQVRIFNFGSTTLQSVNVTVEVDGIVQPTMNLTGLNLAKYQDTVITVGTFMAYVDAINDLRAWTSNPNGIVDDNFINDTMAMQTTGCFLVLAGVYDVGGGNNNFASLEDAMEVLENCGVSGPVILRIAAGNYPNLDTLGAYFGTSDVNTVTFTSLTGNANSVVLGDTINTALTFVDAKHLRFENVTIGNTLSMRGVEFVNTNEDISFYQCNILATPAMNSSDYAPIYYYNSSSSSHTLKNIRIVKNNIYGGYANIYFYYPGGSSSNMTNMSVTIDSNTMTNAYYAGLYSYYYSYYKSVSYNTIVTAAVSATQYGLDVYYYNTVENGIIGNRIHIQSTSGCYGIRSYYTNISTAYGARGNALIANNEIIKLQGSSTSYGFYQYYGNVDFINNSIYIAGTSTCYGIYASTMSSTYSRRFLNNNIYTNTTSSSNYPIYYSSTDYALPSYGNIADYNNYYGTGAYVGYVGGAKTTIADLRQATTQDAHSISIQQQFVDPTQNLELLEYSGMICNMHTSVLSDINGKSRTRITPMGAYSVHIYEGYDLGLSAIVEPVNTTDVFCYQDFASVRVEMQNNGSYPINFSAQPVTLHLDVSGAVTYQKDTMLLMGGLTQTEKSIYTLTNLLPVSQNGNYHIKVSLALDADTLHFDDTIQAIYVIDKIVLPYEVNFDSVPKGLVFKQINGTSGWTVESGDGMNPTITPSHGQGRLQFASATDRGSLASVTLQPINLRGTVQPKLEFWYAHDNAPGRDYTDVKISVDGGFTYQTILNVQRSNSAYTTPTFVRHEVDLSPYTSYSCVILGFEAGSFAGGNQNIDSISISSLQDLLVGFDLIPQNDFIACELDNKTLAVTLSNLTTQDFLFERNPSELTVEVSGAITTTYTYPLVSGKVTGSSILTVVLDTNFDFSINGTYDFKAYIRKSDDNKLNDTAVTSRLINVDLDMLSIEPIGDKRIGDRIYPTLSFMNTGNMPIKNIPLHLQINKAAHIRESVDTLLNPGDTISYTFITPSYVPTVTETQPFYLLEIESELSCDGNQVNDLVSGYYSVVFDEYIDLVITSVEKPDPNECDSGLTTVYPILNIKNIGTGIANNIILYVTVDSAGTILKSYSEEVNLIANGDSLLHSCVTGYNVPNLNGQYKVTLFVSVADESDPVNNTVDIMACAILNDVGVDAYKTVDWSMDQNIPNPASASTRITYHIPQDGLVRFSLTTITGQLIYRQDIPSAAGSHAIDFDTQHLAGGIYYYSMEYQGQRIVKKMTIQK